MAAKVAQGDRAAFAEFVDLYGARLQALARRYAATHPDAEDLTQEIFLNLYRCIGDFRGESSLSTWVYRVALNHCLKHRERSRPLDLALDDNALNTATKSTDPASSAAISELKENVYVALEGLSPEHRDVVILHELHEMTYSECASILEVPVGTVKSRLFYAFRSLKSSLAAYVKDDVFPPISGTDKPTGAATEIIG